MNDLELGRLEDDAAVRLEPVSDDEERPVAAAFFLDHEIGGEVAGGAPAQLTEGLEHEPERDRLSLGVVRAPPVDPVIADGGGEGVGLAARFGHDIQVGVKGETLPAGGTGDLQAKVRRLSVSKAVQAERIVRIIHDRIRHDDKLRRIGEALRPRFQQAADLLLVPAHRGDPDQIAQEIDGRVQVVFYGGFNRFCVYGGHSVISPPSGNQILPDTGKPAPGGSRNRRKPA